MIRLTISADDMQKLEQERFQHPHPRVQRKMEAVYLTGMGLPRPEVARLLHVTEGTVRSYLVAYRDGGIVALERFNPHPHSAALDTHATTLVEAFTHTPPHTVQEAVDRIETLTGIRRSPTQVREWLKKTGLVVERLGPSRPKPILPRNSAS
jgi:transposase